MKRIDYSKLMDVHIAELEKRYGAEASINIGWAQEDDAVTSKVYGKRVALTTEWTKKGFVHYEQEL